MNYDAYTTDNWDGHGATAVSKNTIQTAKRVLELINSEEEPDDHIAPNGSISFEWWNGYTRLFICVLENDITVYSKFKPDSRGEWLYLHFDNATAPLSDLYTKFQMETIE